MEIHGQATLTSFAIIHSLIGFFLQFIGLGGLNWSITIAQWVSVIIMTLLRAIIRQNMALNIPSRTIESNHVLDEAAKWIKDCSHWNIVTVPTLSQSAIRGPSQPTRLAHRVFNTRCQLERLCPWGFQWQATVDLIADAIDSTMNFIFTSPDVKSKAILEGGFRWNLSIEIASRGNESQPFPLEVVELNVSREFLSEGRGWGLWKADKGPIRAALGLWMLHFKLESYNSAEIDRVIDMGKQSPV